VGELGVVVRVVVGVVDVSFEQTKSLGIGIAFRQKFVWPLINPKINQTETSFHTLIINGNSLE
jgi:hypothetical protein